MVKTIAWTLCLVCACGKGDKSEPEAKPRGEPTVVQVGGKMSDEDRAAARHKRLEDMRAKLDTNGDGKLSVDELKAATGRMHFDDPAALDTNHDGDISLDELEAAVKARREQWRGKGAVTGSAGAEPASGSAEPAGSAD